LASIIGAVNAMEHPRADPPAQRSAMPTNRADHAAVAFRAAATLILLRDATQGPEVFMQRRAPGAAFLGGAYVFPGGSLEDADGDPRVLARVVGLTADEANAALALPSGALPYWVAATRECYEEAGILVARDAAGNALAGESLPPSPRPAST